MSEFHTLQELNLDAARYRWAVRNLDVLCAWNEGWIVTHGVYPDAGDVNKLIDGELDVEND